jgi:hypothetical protein
VKKEKRGEERRTEKEREQKRERTERKKTVQFHFFLFFLVTGEGYQFLFSLILTRGSPPVGDKLRSRSVSLD